MFARFKNSRIIKSHIKDCFKINGKLTIKMPKKGEYIKLKNFRRKIKSPFMIYADFESILVPNDNKKQNLNESFCSKYQTYVACSYDYELVCADDKISEPFKPYLGEGAAYNVINSHVMK